MLPAARRLQTGMALLVLPALALAFTVEVVEVVGGRDVEITAIAIERSVVLRIVNREDAEVSCEITLDSGPDEHARRVELKARASMTVNQKILRPSTQRVRVRALCQ